MLISYIIFFFSVDFEILMVSLRCATKSDCDWPYDAMRLRMHHRSHSTIKSQLKISFSRQPVLWQCDMVTMCEVCWISTQNDNKNEWIFNKIGIAFLISVFFHIDSVLTILNSASGFPLTWTGVALLPFTCINHIPLLLCAQVNANENKMKSTGDMVSATKMEKKKCF